MIQSTKSFPPRFWFWLQAAAIVAAGWFIYSPALHGTWLWDDRIDLTENELLRGVTGLWKIWSEPALLYDYYPLKHSVQWLQWQLWGENTFGYHLTNLGLHLANAFLFWRLLQRLAIPSAWLGALLFTVHPIAVESVAWIAELKNVLSLAPLLLATTAAVSYADRERRADYLGALLWFLVAMLCKTSVVMFPCTVLIILWWKRGRLGIRELKATVPFFAISLLLGVVTIWFQQHRANTYEVIVIGGFLAHLALAGTAGIFYFWKCLWPAGLLPIYPRWSVDPPVWWQFLPWLALGVGLAWFWKNRATWGRHALLGFGWFGLHLAPFVGFATISYMRFTWVMDHFTYVSLLGLVAIATTAVGLMRSRVLATGAAIAICAGLAWQARTYASNYRSEVALWSFAAAGNPNTWVAHYNLAVKLDERHDAAGAREHYEAALRLAPSLFTAHNNLGYLLHKSGEIDRAIREFETALRLKPDFTAPHSNLGDLLRELGRTAEALSHLEAALASDKTDAQTWNNYALALGQAGRIPEAIHAFEEALHRKPDYVEAHSNFGSLLRQVGRGPEAVSHFSEALRLKPNAPEVLFNLGNVQRDLGQAAESVTSYERAIQLKPDFAVAHHNLSISLDALGRTAEALEHCEATLRIAPGYAPGHNIRGYLLRKSGQLDAAIGEFETTIKLQPDFADAYRNLAISLHDAGRDAEARARYEQGRRINPALPDLPF